MFEFHFFITDTQLQNINKNILVGWRDPAILKSNIKKLPKIVTHYMGIIAIGYIKNRLTTLFTF